MDINQELKHSAFHRMFEANQRAVFSYYIGHGVDREDAVDGGVSGLGEHAERAGEEAGNELEEGDA